jgi:rubredoxin
MSAAYMPPPGSQPAQGVQNYPPPQGYPPPPPPQGYQPQGYQPQGAPWQQNYPPPPGHPHQNYPQQAVWQGVGEYVPCPRCRRPDPEKVSFTWWGGLIGPRLFKHVKCNGCGLTYNGKSGQSNTTNIVIYSVVLGVIALVIALLVLNN